MKLNMGSGRSPLANGEWEDVDIRPEVKATITADIRHVPRPDNSYDEILLQSVLEHFGKREYMEVLQEAYRLLNKGGKLVLSIPDLEAIAHKVILGGDIYSAANFLFGEQNYEENYHKWAWTFSTIVSDLKKVGFVNIKRVKKILYHYELRLEATK